MKRLKFKTIAIDFDNTITKGNHHPLHLNVPIRNHAQSVIQEIIDCGGTVIIWTCRSGNDETMVRHILNKHNILYHYMNEQTPEMIELFGDTGRKVWADVYIDDSCLLFKATDKEIDWLEIKQLLFEEV